MRSDVAGALVGPALCLPCLAVRGVLVASVVGFAVIGAWFSENALVVGAATVAALVAGALGGLMYVRRVRGTACEIDPTRESIARGAKERVRG